MIVRFSARDSKLNKGVSRALPMPFKRDLRLRRRRPTLTDCDSCVVETMLRFTTRLSVKEKTHPVKANELPRAFFSKKKILIKCNPCLVEGHEVR